MSQLLLRFSRFSLRKDALIHKRVRSFSSSVTCCPYLTLGSQIKKELGDGSSTGDVLLFDPAKEELVTFPDKKIPEELVKSTQIGSSRYLELLSREKMKSVVESKKNTLSTRLVGGMKSGRSFLHAWQRRWFSTSPPTFPTHNITEDLPPYFIFGKFRYSGNNIVFYQASDCEIRYSEKKVPRELLKEPRKTIGASRGWIATLKKRVMCLQDDLNLLASDTNPKRISLPPLVTLPHCQTQIVTNVAMSSSSLEEKDCVVAVKFMGPQLSLCRPAHDSTWTNIRITDPIFFNSPVMFSHRDHMFSLPAFGGYYMGFGISRIKALFVSPSISSIQMVHLAGPSS